MNKLKLKKLYPEINMASLGPIASKQAKHDSDCLCVIKFVLTIKKVIIKHEAKRVNLLVN